MSNAARFTPGDRTLTRRILKRCRDSGLTYSVDEEPVRIGRRKWGRKILAYRVPEHIYREESARRNEEKRVASEKLVRFLAEAQRKAESEKLEKLKQEFPSVPESTLESLAVSRKRIVSPQQVGYQHGLATKTYWMQLGFNVIGEPSAVIVSGKRLYDAFSTDQLTPRKSRMTVESVKAKWFEQFGEPTLVLAQAVRTANRLQKVRRHPEFYDLKDRWIKQHQHYLTLGRVARTEERACWGCDGTGSAYCNRCDGSGIYSSRTLFEHQFEIIGHRFVFHSYVRPNSLSKEPAANCNTYGRPFNADELPCPPQDVLVALVRQLLADGNMAPSSPVQELESARRQEKAARRTGFNANALGGAR